MNLQVFNKVNWKEQYSCKGDKSNMYSEWSSLVPILHSIDDEEDTVLSKFSDHAARDVVLPIVRQLSASLGIAHTAEPSFLTTDKQVSWCMEVICYGLKLPLSELDIIRDCVSIYCEWITSLYPEPKICVPKPLCQDSNMFVRKIISHLRNLFVPRKDEVNNDAVNKQAVLCHRVLRTLHKLAQLSVNIDSDTWHKLIVVLLGVNELLLSPPTRKDDIGDQLSERVISVLFEIWLLACLKCYPSATYWKTLRELVGNWRHRTTLIQQWNRINYMLTWRLLRIMYHGSLENFKYATSELDSAGTVINNMTEECVAQTWFRFLHTMGNPVELRDVQVVAQSAQFLQYAITNINDNPAHHPCLKVLPINFYNAIKGIATLADCLLGVVRGELEDTNTSSISNNYPTVPLRRTSTKIQSTKGRIKVYNWQYTDGRAKCNSILHLLAGWLFDASYIPGNNTNNNTVVVRKGSNNVWPITGEGSINTCSSSGSNSSIGQATVRKGSSSQPNSLNESELGSLASCSLPSITHADEYVWGRSEAIGSLCRIFCSKRTAEEIMPIYLSRFYILLQQALRGNHYGEYDEMTISVLLNSSDLFRVDLDGIVLLLPCIIDAIELVLSDVQPKLKKLSMVDLRRSCIHLLLSVLPLPLHFQNMPIKEVLTTYGQRDRQQQPAMSIIETKGRLVNILMTALQIETDGYNTHMLLGGLLFIVQDTAAFEGDNVTTEWDNNNSIFTADGTDTDNSLISASSVTSCIPPDTQSIDFTHSSNNANANINNNNNDSASALLVRATCLVCERLVSSWKSDLNVSLAALEILSGLAGVIPNDSNSMECKRAVKWLCEYIVYQCKRPPQAHSKDLHWTIVAAFQCAVTWISQRPDLLDDKYTLHTLLEVIELGISGTKSHETSIKLKDAKELKPVSMRVKDAAEWLLAVILEQVDCFPGPCGTETLSCLLDEYNLIAECGKSGFSNVTESAAVSSFKYLVLDNNTLLGLLQEPLGNHQDAQPTITLLLRNAYGRHCWTLQLRSLPRHRSTTTKHEMHTVTHSTGRPISMLDKHISSEHIQRYFPDSIHRIATCKADESLSNIESFSLDTPSNEIDDKLSHLIKQHSMLENESNAMLNEKEGKQVTKECMPPSSSHEFYTTRLLLSHLGLVSREDGQDTLTVLDENGKNFTEDLLSLDKMPSRACHTCYVFYVRSGQRAARDILSNVMSRENVSSVFIEMLHTLGWPVRVANHAGWPGLSSYRNIVEVSDRVLQSDEGEQQVRGGALYNGEKYLLYWSDVNNELAFLVPSLESSKSTTTSSGDLGWYERSTSIGGKTYHTSESSEKKSRAMSLDSDYYASCNRKRTSSLANATVMLVWLEAFQDHATFPTEQLAQYTKSDVDDNNMNYNNDCYLIFLHPLVNGLLRVKLIGPTSRMNLACPLVDGMVISRRVVGPLVRQTVLNLGMRRRLDNDCFQAPYVRRRLKIQDMTKKYHLKMSKAELLTYLLKETSMSHKQIE